MRLSTHQSSALQALAADDPSVKPPTGAIKSNFKAQLAEKSYNSFKEQQLFP